MSNNVETHRYGDHIVMVLPTELPGGVKYRSITQPRISLIAFSLGTAGSLGRIG